MKAYELPARITSEGDLELPERLRGLLPAGKAAIVRARKRSGVSLGRLVSCAPDRQPDACVVCG
ncbi:hypothetical protein FJY70_04400 [candidate division WOR-3 bacterium]|nr:hypothetical protein [candidate division WOR-3 bacterium]